MPDTAATGPYVVPSVNLTQLSGARNITMVARGGQAAIPIVAAVSRGHRRAVRHLVQVAGARGRPASQKPASQKEGPRGLNLSKVRC